MTGVCEPSVMIDDDGSSVASYDAVMRRGPNAASEPRQTMKVDGKVPDVLYVLNHVGWKNKLIECRQSTQPFKNPSAAMENDDDAGEDKVGNEPPVLEIVTTVYSQGSRPSRQGRNRRRQQMCGRPITESFDATRPEPYPAEYYSDPEDPDENDLFQTAVPSMIIHSEHLINALKAVVNYYPKAVFNGKLVKIRAPYRVLYHHRKELAAYRSNQPANHDNEYAAKTAEHIDVLLGFLAGNFANDIRHEEERHALDTPMATFEYFWLLLKPGEVIYSKRYDIWSPFVISSVDVDKDNPDSDDCRVNCWFLESDGSKVDRYMETFAISPWLGEQAISTLPVIPAAFWVEELEAQGGRTMREKQIEEGKMYWDLLKAPQYMEYDGLLINSHYGNRPGGPTGFMCGRVICDAAGFNIYFAASPEANYSSKRRNMVPRHPRQHQPPVKDHLPKNLPHCGCKACMVDRPTANDGSFSGFEDLDPLTDVPPESDMFYLVCSKAIPGFILGSRRWGNLNVANLHPVKPDKEAFKYLVLEDDVKMTVKALIGKFATGIDGKLAPWGNDFVKNKGEGRIFLLHGMPGVGKTCTAECIAEQTNRPLISLTSGDLSVDSHTVEKNLSYFFQLGKRYGALVLLDEADVYLQARSASDIERNSLVSVFLRALEYYRGVLFLTTNRVESFDHAFLSRIHVALHYKNLKNEDRERIWTQNFDRVDRDSHGKIHVAAAAREFVYGSQEVRELTWNGREIRNAMQTALALAENEAHEEGLEIATVGEKHMRAVVKLSKGFKDYVKKSGCFIDETQQEDDE